MEAEACAQMLRGTNKDNHISLILQALHWLPVSFCALFKVLVSTFRVLYSLGARYPKDHLHYQSSHVLQSTEEALLVVPAVKEARLRSTACRAFSVAAPLL